MTVAAALQRLHRRLVPAESDEGWTAYLWLIYLAFFFVEWFFRPVGAVEFALAGVSLLAFLVLYFSARRRRGPAALAHVTAIAALGLAWTPFNAGASVLFIYAASFAYRVGPPSQSTIVVLGIAAMAGLVAWFGQPVFYYWLPGVFVSLIIGAANIHFGERERHNAELRRSQAEVRRLARLAERERIARDLHDVLGHTLSLITVKSALAEKLLSSDPERARSELQSIEQTARGALAEVRLTISGLHEQSLDEAIEQVAASLRAAGIHLHLERDPDLHPAPQVQAMLALVLREAVTNILCHAGARNCLIVIARQGDGMRLEIADDGSAGFKPEGSGIQGMRARIESLGGEFDLKAGKGTRIIARLPADTLAS